jgi:hypothetical protein
MRIAIVAGTVWTVFAVATLIFGVPFDSAPEWYSSYPRPCGGLVGLSPEFQASCRAQQAAINDAWWRFHTLPIFLMILAGYAAVVATWARGRRRVTQRANLG